MSPPPKCTYNLRAPLQKKPDLCQSSPVLQRRSSRIQSKQRSMLDLHMLGSYYKSPCPLEHRPTDLQTSEQPDSTASYAGELTSGPVEVSVPPAARFQEYLTPQKASNLQTRKRRVDGSADRPFKRTRLTEKNLKVFNKMRGKRKPAGTEATGQSSFLEPAIREDFRTQSNSKSSESKPSDPETKSTTSTQRTSTTDSKFAEIALENGILNPNWSKPPANLESLQKRINRRRGTDSPTESEYRRFASSIRRAPNEATVRHLTSMVLLRDYDDRGYNKSYDQIFSNFPKDVGFNSDLSPAKPGMVEGFDQTEFRPFLAEKRLGGAATPYLALHALTLPHLAGEWKGPGKDMIRGQTQASYDGACLVYGRNKARSFLGSPDPTDYAFVSTFTTDGTALHTFAHYSSESQGQLEYHQYPTSSSFLISNYEEFKQGRRRLRNLQDEAKRNSEMLRDELKENSVANQPPPAASNYVRAANVGAKSVNPEPASTGIKAIRNVRLCLHHSCVSNDQETKQDDINHRGSVKFVIVLFLVLLPCAVVVDCLFHAF